MYLFITKSYKEYAMIKLVKESLSGILYLDINFKVWELLRCHYGLYI